MGRKVAALFWLVLTSSSLGALPKTLLESLDGQRTSLADSVKSSRVLVSFWATWCEPCLTELKALNEEFTKKKMKCDLIAINVDTPETSSQVRPTVRFNQFKFPILLDPKHEVFKRFHASGTLPYSILLSSDGEKLLTFEGYRKEMLAQIEAVLRGS